MSDARIFHQLPYEPPAGATDLVLVRHGASEGAVEGTRFALKDGHGDPGLSDLGRFQAELVGARLARQRVDAIYVTSLRRTVETAQPLAARLGIVPAVEADLREVYLGEWEGGEYRTKVADRDPVAAEMFRLQRWDVIPGAEPADAFAARVRAGVQRIVDAHPDQRVVVVTHGGVIGEVLRQVTRSEPWAFVGSENTGISQLVVLADSWRLRRFNDTTHLEQALPG